MENGDFCQGWGEALSRLCTIVGMCVPQVFKRLFQSMWTHSENWSTTTQLGRSEFYCNWQPHSGNPIELSLKSPCLHPVFGPAFTPYPLFQWYRQCKEIWNAENQRLMHKAENNYSNCTGKSSENLSSSIPGKKERQDETQFMTKIGGKTTTYFAL